MEPGSHDPKKIMATYAREAWRSKRPRPPSPEAETALSGATQRLLLLRAAHHAVEASTQLDFSQRSVELFTSGLFVLGGLRAPPRAIPTACVSLHAEAAWKLIRAGGS